MKKSPIGFCSSEKRVEQKDRQVVVEMRENVVPKASVVTVYFPHRGTGWSYYNDKYDLKVGDYVYVDGKLEGYRGQVTEVNYSFKIKLSDYKRVIGLVDTDIKGDFYFAGSHAVTFDKNAIPYRKVIEWFKHCKYDDDVVSGSDDVYAFPLRDLSKMKISEQTAERGHEYYMESRVRYVELDNCKGRAIVDGRDVYEIEFELSEGEIRNLNCSCFANGKCKHEFAAMLQLRETLDLIEENYSEEYEGYFAALSKDVFADMVMRKKVSGKISVDTIGC